MPTHNTEDYDDLRERFEWADVFEWADWDALDELNVAHEVCDRHPDDVALEYAGIDGERETSPSATSRSDRTVSRTSSTGSSSAGTGCSPPCRGSDRSLRGRSSLGEHPTVAEVAVVPESDPEQGDIVKASVVLSEGTDPSDELVEEIQNHVRSELAAHEYPREIEFVEELPKTVTGKIRRTELREQTA